MITNAELVEIYHLEYWNLVRGDELPRGIDLAVFDFGVNSGPGTAIRRLQRVLGVTEDGHLGPATMAAVHRADPLRTVAALMDVRRAYLRSLPTFWRFGEGWMHRCDDVQEAAEAAITMEPHAPVPLHGDANEQSASQGRATPAEIAPPATTERGLALGGSSSLAYVAPGIVARATESGQLSLRALALALLAEPMFWAGMAMLWGGLAAWLWRRRRHAA